MDKVGKVMHEYGQGELHSGSKRGPVVNSRKQAVAIALSEARKATDSAKSRVLKHRMIGSAKNLESLRKVKTHQREY